MDNPLELAERIEAAADSEGETFRAFAAVLEQICILTNTDWQEVSADPRAAIERVHSLAVDAYYMIPIHLRAQAGGQ